MTIQSGKERITSVINRSVDRLSRTNYRLARAYYRHRLKSLDRQFPQAPLIVYQMGKVGSSTVVKSLHEAGLRRRIYHVHFLTPELIEKYEIRRRKYLRTERSGDLRHIWQYKHLRDRLLNEKCEERWKVITLVRDPVARNLATFFEHISVVSEAEDEWKLESAEYEFCIKVRKSDLLPLVDLFFEKCRHDNPSIYFDREFKPVLGIDLYDEEFPSAEGYKIYQTDSFDILLLRLENLNTVAEPALKRFLGLEEFALVNANIGEEKDYADVYDKFKNQIRLPTHYLDRMYTSKFTRHFYTDEEIAVFRKRWTARADDD